MTVALEDAVAWLEAWRDKRLDNIEQCLTAAQRARDYADETIQHFLTRQAASESAERWDRSAERYRADVLMMNRLLEEFRQ